MTEKQGLDNFEEQEADPVAEELLRDAILMNDGPLIDAGEQFSKDTIVLLLGLGLTGEEIKLFQRHEIGLDKFSSLTLSDLDYIGITSNEKKKNIIDCIKKIRKQDKKSLPPLESNSDPEFRSEDSQAMDNVCKHQQTLIKIIPYFRKGLNTKIESTFFQAGISVNHTFEKVALCCVQQAHQVHDQLFLYLNELEENKSQLQKKQNQKLWTQHNRKWWFLAFVAGSCIPLCVWGSRKVTDFPTQWTKMWHFLAHPVPGA